MTVADGVSPRQSFCSIHTTRHPTTRSARRRWCCAAAATAAAAVPCAAAAAMTAAKARGRPGARRARRAGRRSEMARRRVRGWRPARSGAPRWGSPWICIALRSLARARSYVRAEDVSRRGSSIFFLAARGGSLDAESGERGRTRLGRRATDSLVEGRGGARCQGPADRFMHAARVPRGAGARRARPASRCEYAHRRLPRSRPQLAPTCLAHGSCGALEPSGPPLGHEALRCPGSGARPRSCGRGGGGGARSDAAGASAVPAPR